MRYRHKITKFRSKHISYVYFDDVRNFFALFLYFYYYYQQYYYVTSSFFIHFYIFHKRGEMKGKQACMKVNRVKERPLSIRRSKQIV